MAGTAEERSPRRWTHTAAIGAVLLVTLPAGAALVRTGSAADCARTPQTHPPDAIGVPLERVVRFLAQQYATSPRRLHVTADGGDAVEIEVWDAGGDFFHGTVRAVRAESGGWLLATTNACDD
jgi:hypothetical protein